MDLGIKGKKALLAASTSGLGLVSTTALAREGCLVYIRGRDAERLKSIAAYLPSNWGTGHPGASRHKHPCWAGIIDRLASAIAQVSKKPEVTNYRNGLGGESASGTPEDFSAFWKQNEKMGGDYLVFKYQT